MLERIGIEMQCSINYTRICTSYLQRYCLSISINMEIIPCQKKQEIVQGLYSYIYRLCVFVCVPSLSSFLANGDHDQCLPLIIIQ